MPSLIVSSRYSTDSQALREIAQYLGWDTLRLDGRRIPDWFDPPDDQNALFFTSPLAFEIAEQLSCTMLGCPPDWTVKLPTEFLMRELRQMTLGQALELPGKSFVKHSVSKAFPSTIYSSAALADAASNVAPNALVHVGEPVEWSVEYRCFVIDRKIVAISPYKRYGEIINDHSNLLGATQTEIENARRMAESLFNSSIVACPPGFVLDVGFIEGRGWAVVECNECWAAGIYACDPVGVLDTLLRACVPAVTMTEEMRRWDFQKHYLTACPLTSERLPP
jgi:hypothetical protein